MIKTLFNRGTRFPRLGIIRLGVKAVNPAGKEYPKEVEYFVLPGELLEILPERPTSIEVAFPADDPERVFDVWLTRYDGPSLAIKCDGESCVRIGKDGSQVTSRCEKPEIGRCKCGAKALGRLNVILRRSKVFGVYQVLIGGEGRCRDLMTELQMYARLAGGLTRAWFTLERVKTTEQAVKDDGSRMARVGYPVHLRLNYSPDRMLGPMVPPAGELTAGEAPAPAHEIDDHEAAGDAPDDEKQQIAMDLWTITMDAAGDDTTKASALAVKIVKQHLGKTVKGFDELPIEELRKLAGLIRPEPST